MYPDFREDTFTEHGDTYKVTTSRHEDGATIHVVITRDGEEVSTDTFDGRDADEAANSFVRTRIEFTDPNQPSLEERLAPFGPEYEREWMEEHGRGGIPF